MISDLEWWLTYEAGCVLANNQRTHWSLKNDLQLPEEKVRLIDPMEEGWQKQVLDIYQSLEKK
jgi:hypothetical protein